MTAEVEVLAAKSWSDGQPAKKTGGVLQAAVTDVTIIGGKSPILVEFRRSKTKTRVQSDDKKKVQDSWEESAKGKSSRPESQDKAQSKIAENPVRTEKNPLIPCFVLCTLFPAQGFFVQRNCL